MLWFSVYLRVAGGEHLAGDDAAVLLGPGLPVWIGGAGVLFTDSIWTAWRILPTVSKFQNINNYCSTSGGKVIILISVIISTKTTDTSLWR